MSSAPGRFASFLARLAPTAGIAMLAVSAAAVARPLAAQEPQAPSATPPSASTVGVIAGGVPRTVPIATRALARGATLTPADYDVAPTTVRLALRDAAAGDSGWVTRRPIAAGEPLVEPAVGRPALVTAGQLVSLVAEHDAIRLSIRGTAATSGALGDRVWVRLEGGRRLRGVVTAPATVRADSSSRK